MRRAGPPPLPAARAARTPARAGRRGPSRTATGASALLLFLLGAAPALPAGRTPYGGSLAAVHLAVPLPDEPALADSPLAALLRGLVARGVCRLDAQGRAQPALAHALARTHPHTLEVTLPGPAQAEALARAWSALVSGEQASPYRALLHPLRGEGRQLSARGAALELSLAYPWPDLERSLCHPALSLAGAPALGPFRAGAAGALHAQPLYPEGRPYLDTLTLTALDERGLARAAAAREVQLALGVAPGPNDPAGAALHATYLAFSPRRLPADFRQALESALDRDDLTRLFVRAPALPMPHLLPPGLLAAPPRPRPAPPAPPARGPAARTVTLLYDEAVADQRAVAERLQVRLHERGYTVALQGLARAALRARWARGDFELMLHALLLPPVAGPALAVVLDAGGRRDLLGVELPLIGALAEPGAREARARERALALAPSVPLVPLYAQGLALRAAPGVRGLAFDAQGLPLLDGLHLPPGGGAP